MATTLSPTPSLCVPGLVTEKGRARPGEGSGLAANPWPSLAVTLTE